MGWIDLLQIHPDLEHGLGLGGGHAVTIREAQRTVTTSATAPIPLSNSATAFMPWTPRPGRRAPAAATTVL